MAIMVAAMVMSGCSVGDPGEGSNEPGWTGALRPLDTITTATPSVPYNCDGESGVTDFQGYFKHRDLSYVCQFDLSNINIVLAFYDAGKRESIAYSCDLSGITGVTGVGGHFDYVPGDT
ncbi:hypothetical protein C9926_03455, partial [Sulfurovum lithotrophicum]